MTRRPTRMAAAGRRAVLLIVSMLIWSAGSSPVQAGLTSDQVALFQQGNELVQREDFTAARQAYQDLIRNGVESPDVYFNLGNAALQDGDLGVAVWAYLRAQTLAPADDDVAANLAFARAQTLDAEPGDSDESWFLNQLATAIQHLPARRMLRVAAACFLWLTVLLLTRWVGRRRVPQMWVWGVGALWVIVALGGIARLGMEGRDDRVGVITGAEVEARNQPGPDGKSVFSLHAGTEVVLLRTLGGWVEVELGRELKGWIPKTDLIDV